MGKKVNSAMDGFSSLPEPIIHHIMSLVPTKDATHMSILSSTLYSSWRSFPIMDFDYHLFKRSCSLGDVIDRESFLDFVVNSLRHRELNTCLEKLRFFGSPGSDDDLDSKFKRIINFALENNVREVELDFQRARRSHTYSLPPAIFSAKSIKTLTLKQIKSVSQDLILSCPCLENFNLIACEGFETVILASNTKLKVLRVEKFSDIKDIHFESPVLCLESFSCYSFVDSVPVKFNISGYTTLNLKHLRLRGQRIPDRLFEIIFTEFLYLETLIIQDCSASKKQVKIHLEYLRTLELNGITFYKVEIDAPSMVSFTYRAGSVITTEIDISSMCTNLKHLQYRGRVPYRWFRNSFSEFPFLETLKLHIWSASEKIKFHFEYLKTLELHLSYVDQVEIRAPSMVSFSYIYSSYAEPPEIFDISSSYTNLKHLRFDGEYIPHIWVKHNFSQFLSLETLELHNCRKMKKIRLDIENLKSLELMPCGELSQIKIEAPNLVSITYFETANVIYPPKVIITSKAKIDVKLNFFYRTLDDNNYISLRNFIKRFAQYCQTLTLRCRTLDSGFGSEFIYPGRLRKILVPPVYDLKHLKVELEELSCSPLELIYSLLWLAPHPNTISIIVDSQVKSLKFHYRYKNLKSWRQDLKEVTMENFTDRERTILQKYFFKH